MAAAPALFGQASPTVAAQGIQTLCQPQVIGNRRIPKESVLSRLFSRQNDLYDPLVVERERINFEYEPGLPKATAARESSAAHD